MSGVAHTGREGAGAHRLPGKQDSPRLKVEKVLLRDSRKGSDKEAAIRFGVQDLGFWVQNVFSVEVAWWLPDSRLQCSLIQLYKKAYSNIFQVSRPILGMRGISVF